MSEFTPGICQLISLIHNTGDEQNIAKRTHKRCRTFIKPFGKEREVWKTITLQAEEIVKEQNFELVLTSVVPKICFSRRCSTMNLLIAWNKWYDQTKFVWFWELLYNLSSYCCWVIVAESMWKNPAKVITICKKSKPRVDNLDKCVILWAKEIVFKVI